MNSARGWVSLFTWDGVLPIAVAAVPSVVSTVFPESDIAEVAAVVLVPIVAAFVRSTVGMRQLRQIHGRFPPLFRQIALAVAIALLLLLEGLITMLTFATDEPPSAWLIPVCLFACYWVAIAVAFRPLQASGSSIP